MNPQEYIEKRVKKETIEGKEVQIHLLPASEGIVLASKLGATVLPSLGSLQENSDGEISILEVAAIVIANIEQLDVLDTIKKLLKGLTVNGQGVSFDDYFMANYGELVKILTFSLKENFSSFFSNGDMSLA